MKRFRLFRLLLLMALLLSVAGHRSHAADRPNILLICVDDLKPVAGCYGGQAKTPHLDALAARGVLFERAWCNQAVCSPSRNALMTGRRPQTLGIYDLATNFRKAAPDAVTLAQAFMKAGYRTEAMGKIFHVGHGNGEDAASWSVPHWKPGAAQYREPANGTRAGGSTRGAPVESADVPDDHYADGQMANEAVARIQAAKARPEVPFFIAVGFHKPHLPFVAPKKYWDLYDPAALKLAEVKTPPEGAPSYAPQFGGELRQYSGVPKEGALSGELERRLVHGYHAAASYMDAQLGRVLAGLAESGLADRTIVVLWGDHGWHLGDHGMWCKHTNYEQAARIPLIIAAPGVKPGRSRALVETVDIYPTLCELSGVTPPALDGRSFAAVLREPARPHRDFAMHVFPRGERIGRALRDNRYRLVEWKVPGAPAASAELELYDYEADPLERRNLAAEQPETVTRLRALLAAEPEAKPQWKAAASAARPAKTDRAALFAKKDADRDGKLTRDEFLANQPDPDKAPARFPKFDTNNDGTLSREEFISGGK